MAAWQSLAGYLVLRPAGALSRLKARKRLWYVFDEKSSQLLYYKNEDEAQSKEPLGLINVRGAAISLALDENNQFVIHSEGKEHVLVADNHESMMLWVLALQARQDSTDSGNQDTISSSNCKLKKQQSLRNTSRKEFELENLIGERSKVTKPQEGKAKIIRTHSLQLHDTANKTLGETEHNPLTRMRSLWAGHSMDSEFSVAEKGRPSMRGQLSTVAQSIDNEESDIESTAEVTSKTSPEDHRGAVCTPPASSSNTTTSPVSPSTVAGTTDTNNNDHNRSNHRTGIAKSPSDDPLCEGSTNPSSDTESCDDSDPSDAFAMDEGVHVDPTRTPHRTTTTDRVRFLSKMKSEGIRPEDIAPLKDRASSLSGTSVSSDSAVGTSECAHSIRQQELEAELMSTKRDLAKALNIESAYKSIIEEKIVMVTELEDRLKAIEDVGDDIGKPLSQKVGSGVIGNNSGGLVHKMQEKCRILQNHNRFLNEEVLKLSKMLQHEQSITQLKQLHIQKMEGENDQLKRDYVFLLQSSLRITNCDGPETMEVYLYGGARHKERVLLLLEEARRINPTLPAYENLTRSVCHVDGLGFRRACTDECLILHYICRQLHQHYCTLVPGYELHQQHWKRYLRQHPTLSRTKELKSLVRVGIPAHLRSRVWALLYKSKVRDIMEDKGSHYYSYLCSLAPDDERVSQHKRQIALDLLRTMPDNIRFSDSNADGVRKMQEVLQAFCLHNPVLGYCQGMNFLVGTCLLFLEPEDAFWCLVAITERYFTPNYFDQNLIGAQADQEVLKDLLRERLPALWHHLARIDIELCTVTLNWFLAIFFDCVPFETLLRIWDCFLLEGPKVLFRFSLAILKLNEKIILAKHDTVSIMRQLKAAAKLCFDVDSLFKTAFEGMRPFTRRQDIAAKQACYYKTLKEHAKKMEMEKVALKDREKMLSEMEILSANQLVIECAAVYDKDKLWLCHGHQNGAQITKVNCEENIMYRLNIELESRVMCMHSLDDDTMLLGTLSHFVHAYSTRSRRLMWETRLNDSVLALSSHEEDGLKQVYAGLADGTIAVIENIQTHASKPETFYIMIGSSPVTCIRLVDRRLWCGSGNRVIILSARTLDAVDQFQTSSSVLDYISMLVPDEQGVWVTIRGSSILQLWDAKALTCKLLYDVKDNRYPRSPKQQEEETNVNHARITAVLPFSGSVLVGTAEGSLIIFDIVARISRSASSADFPSRRQLESTTVDHIQERIQELLLEQKKRDQADETTILEIRNRVDSGCYTTPSRTPLRRESTLAADFLPTQHENECENRVEEEQKPDESGGNSPDEDRSETTSCSTIRRVETDPATSPESQPSQYCGEVEDRLRCDVTKQTTPPEATLEATILCDHKDGVIKDVDLTDLKRIDTDRDSGRSSSSTQGKLCDDMEEVNSGSKRHCTCHQLTTKTVKCRHCLLETSEALRKLFNKYSLSTSPANHIDSTTRYQNLLNNTKSRNILWKDTDDHQKPQSEQIGSSKILNDDCTDEEVELQKDDDCGLSESSQDSRCHNHQSNNNHTENVAEDEHNNENSPAKQSRNMDSAFTESLMQFYSNREPNTLKRNSLLRAVSADDVTRWVKSQDTLTSSLASDSYDFDDVFVAYTEDESGPSRITSCRIPIKPSTYRSKETEAILESIKAKSLSRRRSSNIFDYSASYASSKISCRTDPWTSPWYSAKSRPPSPWIDTSATSVSSSTTGRYYSNSAILRDRLRLLDVRTQLPPWCRDTMVTESETGSGVKIRHSDSISARNVTSPTNWLSYEDSVTENDSSISKSAAANRDLLQLGDWSSGTQKGSDTASNISFCSTEIPYTFELNLQEKIKISDKPIKCLLQTRCGGEPTIISCAGCYGDDEAVLKWTKLGDEKLWTNDPIIEVCPYTNAIKPSPYARSRLPHRTTVNTDSESTPRVSRSSVTSTSSSASSVVGSGLAKVQNMFLRVHDKV